MLTGSRSRHVLALRAHRSVACFPIPGTTTPTRLCMSGDNRLIMTSYSLPLHCAADHLLLLLLNNQACLAMTSGPSAELHFRSHHPFNGDARTPQ